jgi:peroxiredoxin Q/BCP
MGRQVRVGQRAPDFTLPSQSGERVRLAERIGRTAIVLYFYPRDETAGCTAEACAFRDSYEAFTDAGAEVIGVSSDPVDAHQRFAARLRLPFTLLSDTDGAVRERYGVAKWLGLFPGRVTFVIDRAGVVRHIFSSQLEATRHVREALAALDADTPG